MRLTSYEQKIPKPMSSLTLSRVVFCLKAVLYPFGNTTTSVSAQLIPTELSAASGGGVIGDPNLRFEIDLRINGGGEGEGEGGEFEGDFRTNQEAIKGRARGTSASADGAALTFSFILRGVRWAGGNEKNPICAVEDMSSNMTLA